jgi:uncharacterized membrane protein YdbT with pleckstrin-like domain
MSYLDKHLIEGEAVIYSTRLHWIVLVEPILLGLLFGLPGAAMLVRSATGAGGKNVTTESEMFGGAVLLLIALVFIVRGILEKNATEMTVTNKRLVAKVGVAARRTIELLLSRVESIGVEESMMGRMLGYGTVIVRGTGGTPEFFDGIARPLEFRTHAQQQIETAQGKSR